METIDKKRLFTALKRRFWVIAVAAVGLALIFFGVTKLFVKPEYTATTKLYVNNSSFSVGGTSFSISASELTAAQGLVDTYIVIMNSKVTLSEVIEKTQVPYEAEGLRDMITAAPINETEIFEVSVTSHDPYEAERIANAIAMVLPERIAQIVDGSSVRVVEYADVPQQRSSPSYFKSVLLGFLVGGLFSATAVVFLELMDDKISSEDFLTTAYPDVPLLCVIPDAREQDSNGYYRGYYEDYRTRSSKKSGGKK